MNKLYEMFESWYINYIKHMNINIPDRYIDINEVYETCTKKKMNPYCNKPDLEYPDEELQLSVNDAIEGIDRYIENGGYKYVE